MKLLNFKGSGLICLGLTLLDFSLPVNAAALPVDRNTGLALPVDRPTGVTQPVDIIRRKLHARATSEVPTPRILEEDPYLLEIFTLRIWEYWSQKTRYSKTSLVMYRKSWTILWSISSS